jgi:hypothetical protein
MRPWALDLCCGGGGFSAGIRAAGFNVLGVDLCAQPHYPFPFIEADALTVDLSGFALIVASPPCQRWSIVTPPARRGLHPDLLTPLRERLIASGIPYVIENVPGAPMRDPVQLCGRTLRLGVQRHRLFESSMPLVGTPCLHDDETPAVGVYGTHGGPDGTVSVADARAAMGTSWLPWDELAQSIPPAYGYFIGSQAWAHIGPGPWPLPPLVRDACVMTNEPTNRDDSRPAEIGHGPENGRDQCRQVSSVTETAGNASRRRTLTSAPQSDVPAPPCGYCGAYPASRPRTGRWGLWCSHACRQAAYRARQAQTAKDPLGLSEGVSS